MILKRPCGYDSNYAEAQRLYRLAADYGDTDALRDLAEMQDDAGEYAEAERLALEAASAGNTSALRTLARRRLDASRKKDAARL